MLGAGLDSGTGPGLGLGTSCDSASQRGTINPEAKIMRNAIRALNFILKADYLISGAGGVLNFDSAEKLSAWDTGGALHATPTGAASNSPPDISGHRFFGRINSSNCARLRPRPIILGVFVLIVFVVRLGHIVAHDSDDVRLPVAQ